MTPKDQVRRLEGLLERVRKNAAKPRSRAAATPMAMSPSPPASVASVSVAGPRTVTGSPAPPYRPPPPLPPPIPEPPIEPIVLAPPPAMEETTMVRAITHDDVAEEQHVVEVEELLEEEIVDITDVAEEALSSEMPAYEEEEPPASSRRPIAANMSEALAEAAHSVELDEGREVPLKTPPPESGPQEAPPIGLGSPPLPDVDELDDRDIVSRSQPTTEQLGNTIELEPAEPLEFELAPPPPPPPPPAPVPRTPEPPPPPPEPVRPEVVARPRAVATPSAFVSAARSFKPESFVELLDASLSL